MARLSADHHRIAMAARERLGHGGGRIKAFAVLIERGHGDAGPELYGAGIGRRGAGEQIDQCGLAGAVRPNDADAVAARDADGEVADDGPSFIGLAEVFGLDHQHARRVGGGGSERGFTGRAGIGAALLAKRLQGAEAADIALAPRGDAVAQPMLFGDNLAVELVLVALLLGQHFVAPGFEGAKAALDAARLATVEPHRAA